MRTLIRAGLIILVTTLSLGACVSREIFPPEVMEGVPPTFDYKAWRGATAGHPGLKVQLGGRIVGAEETPNGTIIVAEQLPIVNHPAYGPSDAGKREGEYEFAFLYKGKLDKKALFPGNRFVMVGKTQGKQETVMVDGAPKSEPYLVAQCVHIWNTEGREIADFISGGVGAGFTPLEENTYCEPKK